MFVSSSPPPAPPQTRPPGARPRKVIDKEERKKWKKAPPSIPLPIPYRAAAISGPLASSFSSSQLPSGGSKELELGLQKSFNSQRRETERREVAPSEIETPRLDLSSSFNFLHPRAMIHAVKVGKELARKHFIHHIFRDNDSEDEHHLFYRFLDHDPAIPKGFNFGDSTDDDKPKRASEVSRRVTKLMCAILEAFTNDDN